MVVNFEFVELLRNVRRTRDVHVEYEKCLSVPSLDHQTMSDQIRAPWLFNLDPLALLFMLKEKNRAQDFFNKINRDGDSVLSYEEFKDLFKVRVNLKHDWSNLLKNKSYTQYYMVGFFIVIVRFRVRFIFVRQGINLELHTNSMQSPQFSRVVIQAVMTFIYNYHLMSHVHA